MSWKFPRNRIQSNEPTTPEKINENFFEIVHESGNLNEHNFQANAISDRTVLAATAGYVVKHSYKVVNPGIVDGSAGADNTTSGALNDIIGSTNTWVAIADMSATIQTEDSILWIMGSAQYMNACKVAIAVSVDGYVLPETILGGVTQDNDPGGFGMRTSWAPYTVDAVIPVSSGEHTIEIVARFKEYSVDSANCSTVQNRELIIVELRR